MRVAEVGCSNQFESLKWPKCALSNSVTSNDFLTDSSQVTSHGAADDLVK